MFPHLVAVFEWEYFKLRAKNLGWFVKTACYLSRENFWTETIFLKGCSFLKLNSEIVPKLFELSVSLLSSKSLETAFFCQRQCSKYTNTFWQKFIGPYCFLTADKNCLVFCQKKFRKVVKTSFQLSKETLEAMMFSTEIFIRIIFEVWAENFLMFLKTLFFEVPWTFPKRFFLFLRILTNIVGIWTKFCALSGQRLRRSVKFPYYISNCFLEEKISSEIVKLFAFHTLIEKA